MPKSSFIWRKYHTFSPKRLERAVFRTFFVNFSSQDFSLQTLRMRLLCYRKIKLHLRKLNFSRGLTWCQCMWNMGKLTLTPLKLQFLGWYGYDNTPFYGADAKLILNNYSIQPQCPIQPPRPFLSFLFEVAFQSRKLLKSLVSRYLFMLWVQKSETLKFSEIQKGSFRSRREQKS